VIVPSVFATGAAVLLWAAWIARRRSAALIAKAARGQVAPGSTRAQTAGTQAAAGGDAFPVEELPPELPAEDPPGMPPSPREQQ
jgi:hypothetical protein